MPLLQQWHRRHPWVLGGILGIAGGLVGFGGAGNGFATSGTISSASDSWEHPLRTRILNLLDRKPGLPYRELQRELNAANGTLRHHLDVLIANHSVTVVHVNGRSCHYAGAPAQMEIMSGVVVGGDEHAAAMMPVGLSTVQKLIVARLSRQELPKSQAQMARELGRSRASVHSAVTVLRRRGILHATELTLAPHLSGLRDGGIDYDWLDGMNQL
ncbi:MAG: winged helix-turn-helix transcriptional regulator [Candidatus Thalassarchaeaceae archaeon]|nr:hypothetical protein [Euryarchaeota archaeon]RAH09851.1 MAG: hypothetical protein CMA04_002850 [Euryarchaeota archaeon]RPG75426.1 MAG: winged helix-turn-helix transcriptional regulator [Euryarchaeota archaeon TMED85]|tara:strand:+ start:4700 stop:5341 length:642 start_codon:yes stop_codon:yes gene_type:complete